MKAYYRIKEILKSKDILWEHREWLKDYEGKDYSIAIDGKHHIKWQTETKQYKDSFWNPEVNCIKELGNRLRIEFDDKKEDGNKDKEKIKLQIDSVKQILKEKGWGFIESTHQGASNYLWIEFTRELKDKEKESFLLWISPNSSEVDLNFASSKKVFPVLFAVHWKHSYQREMPIEYFEGNQIDYDSLNIKIDEKKILRRKIKNRSFEYVTGIKNPFEAFGIINQVNNFQNISPFFYDRNNLFWMWDEINLRWKVTDEVDILNMISDVNKKDVISSRTRTEIINSMKQQGRKYIPEPIKKTWIQFKDTIYDIQTGEHFKVTPKYFVTNPIPHEVSGNPSTPTIDRIIIEWVGEKYLRTMHEIIAYCLLPDYPINRLFCFIGEGLNGKSKFLELLKIFIGESNCCSTELDTLLNSRFEITKLHKKLICLLGETNFNEIRNSSILKKLTGGDLIGFEYKNKNPFDELNYAKILIATNNLPITNDKTTGFYRRWTIIDFINKFTEKKDIIVEIPKEEYSNLATQSLVILNELITTREFTHEGTIEERMKKFEDHADPLEKFIKEFTVEDFNGFIWKFDFEKKLSQWLAQNRFRQISDIWIGRKMKEKGYDLAQRQSDWLIDGESKKLRAWVGIAWKDKK